MAVVHLKSTQVTKGDATPKQLVDTRLHGGRVRDSVGHAEVANGDSIGSTFRLVRVKSSDRIKRVLLSCDAISTTGAADIGVYEIAANGGGVVDADHFGSAVVLTSALVHSDVTHEADAADAGAGFGLADKEKPLWQSLGLAADPGKEYDIALTLTAAAGGAGTVALNVEHVDGN